MCICRDTSVSSDSLLGAVWRYQHHDLKQHSDLKVSSFPIQRTSRCKETQLRGGLHLTY